jgi:drug/metabolite transporter (DMT)-like permease
VTRTRHASPPALEANDPLVTIVGTVAWAVALVVLLVLRDQIPAGQRWWIWTCATGVVMGLFALWFVPRLKRGRARSAERRSHGGGARK